MNLYNRISQKRNYMANLNIIQLMSTQYYHIVNITRDIYIQVNLPKHTHSFIF